MEQLRADIQNVNKGFKNANEEFQNVKSTFTDVLKFLEQDARPPRRATPRETAGQPHHGVATRENLVHSLRAAYFRVERKIQEISQQVEKVQEISQQVEKVLAGANPSFNTDTPARGRSSGADSRPTDEPAPLISSSPMDSANNTSPNAPPADDTALAPPNGSSPGNGSSVDAARSSPNGSPPNYSPTDGDPRRPLLSSRPVRGPSALLCADSSSADGLYALPGVPPSTGFTLRPSDLGEHLIPKLQTLIKSDKFKGKLRRGEMELWLGEMRLSSTALLETIPRESTQQGVVLGVVHKSGKDNTSRLHIDEPLGGLQLTRLSDVTKPSGEDTEQYLEELSKNPPKNPIPYYVGPLAGPLAEKLQSDFPSGKEVCQLGDVPGVSTLYGHIGGKGSGTAFHCEDANLRSYNLALIGWKIWIMIKVDHTAKFEALIRRLTKTKDTCDQFVRHTSILIPPSKLRAENIDFDIICAGPGEMVLTQPRQYHAVINFTDTVAIATNFVLPGENPIPETLSVCPEDGFYGLDHEMVPKPPQKRKDHGSASQQRRKRPKLQEPVADREDSVVDVEDSVVDVVDQLVHKTTSQDAILRFTDLVRVWRSAGDDVCEQFLKIGKSYQPKDLDSLRRACGQNSQLFSFLEILTSVYLVRNLGRNGKVTPKAIDELLKNRKLDNKTTTRKSIQNELAGYRKWDQLCGQIPHYTYDGILCFVPPVFNDQECNISRWQVQRLSNDDTASFRSMLQQIECVPRLCKAGMAFQSGIFGEEFPKRRFEALSSQELSTRSLADLLDLLEVDGGI